MLYRGMDRAQLDAAYNNSAAVPERDAIVADWAARSAKARCEYAGRLDLAYGHTPRERLDLFLAADPQGKRSARRPAQAAARVASSGCQFQGRSSAMRRAGWSAMRASTSAR